MPPLEKLPVVPLPEKLDIGPCEFMKEWTTQMYHIIKSQLFWRKRDFHLEDINNEAKRWVRNGCQIEPPNVVILEAGEAPRSFKEVHDAVDMYLKDFSAENQTLDIACDEAIFRRLKNYSNDNQPVNAILGQWHTNKDMCAALVKIFSGYGLFNLAASVGTRFLDKFEKVVEYQATFRTLELVWAAVGIAIRRYLKTQEMTEDDIWNTQNNVLKVWHLFFCWGGWLKLHKFGIRMGDFDLQIAALKAFAPLFPVAGKSNYAESVTRFLATVESNKDLQQKLRIAGSINLTEKEHYLGYDEALERFGVLFIKQFLVGHATDKENLMNNIRSAQTIHERLIAALKEFLGDLTAARGTRAVDMHKDAIWKTADLLTEAFESDKPEEHKLFRLTTQLTPEGYELLFKCYLTGIQRIQKIYRQDIRKTEVRDTTGRREKSIKPMKAPTYSQLRKEQLFESEQDSGSEMEIDLPEVVAHQLQEAENSQ
jgi:hypothetical protein